MIKLYNTRTHQLDELTPQDSKKVTLYTCGPTVYDYLHVGNWTAYIYWDTLVRLLLASGHRVKRVMNITDVGHLVSDADEGEDKLEKGARREGKTAWEVAQYYEEDFLDGMAKLNLVRPQVIAKATDYINKQLEMIRILKRKGSTYQTSDGIYFDTNTFPTYADFARLDLASLIAGARVDFNSEKRNVSDFALWKFSPANSKRDMEWATPSDLLEDDEVNSNNHTPNSSSSPMGFPGWHLECSAIALTELGNTLDIHTGGIDHIPIHHTNEIAQSETVTGNRFVNIWMHNNHLKVEGTKISKSLKNGYSLQDIEAKGFSVIDFRMLVLQGHYQSEGNFTFESLQSARQRLLRWRNFAALRWQLHDTIKRQGAADNSDIFSKDLLAIIGDNLSTPKALKYIDETISEYNLKKLPDINQHELLSTVETIDNLLGLKLAESTPDISDQLKQQIIQRNRARESKDWSEADKIRDSLLEQGVVLNDSGNETIWQFNS